MSAKRLWASVEPDAFVWDRQDRLVADPAKVRAINHVGRVLQGQRPAERPAVAAGPPGADPGRRLAARHRARPPISPITCSAPARA